MKTTVQYLDAVRKKLDLPSDYATAKVLGVTTAAVSRYRNGLGGFDDATAAKVAELLDLDPLEVISACNFERAKDDRTKAIWETIWGKAAGAIVTSSIVGAVFVGTMAPTPSQAATHGDNQRNGATLCVM